MSKPDIDLLVTKHGEWEPVRETEPVFELDTTVAVTVAAVIAIAFGILVAL